LLLRALAIINPVVRELLEMQYQFEEPFIVDSSKITTRLGVTATPLDQSIAETFKSYAHTSQPYAERARS
jgi:nucleoside-diphosphate-sugar epimerase